MLRKHQPDHILLRAARADAATGLLDIKRLGDMLSRIRGQIIHKSLEQVSPLAVPVMLEIGREMVYGEAADAMLAEAGSGSYERTRWDEEGQIPRKSMPAPRDLLTRTSVADCDGVLYRPEEKLLAVADLHFEKGSSFARRGMLVPPYDTAATLARLATLISRYRTAYGDCARRQFSRWRRAGAAGSGGSRHAGSNCSAAATGSGSPAITIPILQPSRRGIFARYISARRPHLPP